MAIVPRVHQATQHKLSIRGLEAVTFVSNHHFPRHAHDQFGFGVVSYGAQRSWSAIGAVYAGPGDCIMANPGETADGFDYTGAGCAGWMKQAGFRETRVEHLVGPDSMVIGIK